MEELKNREISLIGAYKARQVIGSYLTPSKLEHDLALSKILGFDIYFKYENQNLTNSFKIRGGINIAQHVKQLGYKGLVTFSTGNHGISVATSARLQGLDAKIVVPIGANPAKVTMIENAGAEVIEYGNNFDESALLVNQLVKSGDYYFVHPANEPELINGVATEFIEVIEQLPDLDVIILPIGGGSELAAATTVLKTVNPSIKIFAVQAEQSSAAYHSWKTGKIVNRSNSTFAGGFATGSAYQTTFDIYKNQLEDFVLLNEEENNERHSINGSLY